jgi:hypothetical protein
MLTNHKNMVQNQTNSNEMTCIFVENKTIEIAGKLMGLKKIM